MKLPVIFLVFVLVACDGKEKGNVKVTATIHNGSSDTLVVSDRSGTFIVNLIPGQAFSLAQEKRFDSPSKPLCCPCAGEADRFIFTPSNLTKKLNVDVNDATLWNKQTRIRIENWICTFTIQPADIVAK